MSETVVPVEVQAKIERGNNIDPLSCYQEAGRIYGEDNVFILESLSGPSRDRRASIVGMHPLFTISIYEGKALLNGEGKICQFLHEHLLESGFAVENGSISLDSNENIWRLLRCIREPFSLPRRTSPSLAYFGYFSYDSVRFVENIPSLAKDNKDYPIISLTVFQTLVYFHAGGTVETLINNSMLWTERNVDDYPFVFNKSIPLSSGEICYPDAYVARDSLTKENFLTLVDAALRHIRIGDIYQIQLGHEVEIDTTIKPIDVYRALRRNNPSPYMYLAHLGGIDLIGASPELFVRHKDNLIEMRPIAGTVGKSNGADAGEMILSMTRSEKERAEHVMLVDLCRNDIGRVCQPGSLEVDELMIVEEYSHLYHMVSNVRGVLRDGFDAFDIMKASFPAGTMTGAPKVRAMELIDELEDCRRGIYAGAVGLIGFDDSINTALCIRSAVHVDGTYYLRASAGVVADSQPESEWMETFYKMSSVFRAVTGQEMIK